MRYFQCSCLNLHSKRVFRKAYVCVVSQCFYQFVWRRKVDPRWLTLLPSTVIPLETSCKCLPFRRFHQSGLYPTPLFFWELQKAELLTFFQNNFFIYLAEENTLFFFSYSTALANQEISYLQSGEYISTSVYSFIIASVLIAACFYNCL